MTDTLDDNAVPPTPLSSDSQDSEPTGETVCPHCASKQAECEEYKRGWQRAVADYKNLQKEMEQRRLEWAGLSKQVILEEFFPVYDNFKKATTNVITRIDTNTVDEAKKLEQQWQNWKQGVELIKKQFGDILKNHGVEEIKTVGQKFDPTVHEAVSEEAVEGKETGEVLREVDGGYAMNGRVMKVAKVVVAK